MLSLDVDGVLHPAPHCGRSDVAPLDWLLVLYELLEGHEDVVLLLHSSWREVYTVSDLREMFGRQNLQVAPAGEPGVAVQQWVAEHAPRARVLVIDDDASRFSDCGGAREVVVCDPCRGLSDAWVQEVVRRCLG